VLINISGYPAGSCLAHALLLGAWQIQDERNAFEAKHLHVRGTVGLAHWRGTGALGGRQRKKA